MNIGAPWPDLEEAESRVRGMQSKLHQWAVADPDRRFGDLYKVDSLVTTPFSRQRFFFEPLVLRT